MGKPAAVHCFAAAAAWGLLCGIAAAAAGVPVGSSCVPQDGEAVTVESVADDLTLQLRDGRNVRLAGIAPAGSVAADARRKLAAWLTQAPATLQLLAPAPDRWGRMPALVFASSGGTSASSLSVATAIVDAGFARARPEPEIHACWSEMLSAEDAARRAGLGLWSDPYYAVRHANDARLGDLQGTLVLVEGQVARVGETRTVLYLDLLPARGTLALRIAKRNAFMLDQLGASKSDWVGRSIRVRGLLDERNGPQIELIDPDQLEVLKQRPTGERAR